MVLLRIVLIYLIGLYMTQSHVHYISYGCNSMNYTSIFLNYSHIISEMIVLGYIIPV